MKKNFKIIMLISCFSLFSFVGISAMESNDFSDKKMNELKKHEFKLNEHNDFINKIVEKENEEE